MTSPVVIGSYLDTSVLVAALVPVIPHHRACVNYCRSLVTAQARVFISSVIRIEFAQAWFLLPRMPYVDDEMRHDHRLGAWDRNVAVRERWMEEGVDRFETVLAGFHQVVELPLDRGAWRASIGFIARHRLRSHDAIHAATALSIGRVDFASVAGDFRRVPSLRLRLLRDSPT